MNDGVTLSARTLRAFEKIDELSSDLRECVHEFGWPIVQVLMKHGVLSKAHIREIVSEIWSGARSSNQRGPFPRPMGNLDWLLSQRGFPVGARTLWRVVADGGYAIVPTGLTVEMLEASLNAVSGGNVICTKAEKHQRRYNAAVLAYVRSIDKKLGASA